MLVLAFATVHELTLYRPEVEMRRALASLVGSPSLQTKLAVDWVDSANATQTSSTFYAAGKVHPSGPMIGDYDLQFHAVRLNENSSQYNEIAGEARFTDGQFYVSYIPPGPTVAASPFQTANTWVELTPPQTLPWHSAVVGLNWPAPTPFDTPVPWTNTNLNRLATLIGSADIAYASGSDKTRATLNDVPCHLVTITLDKAATESFLVNLVSAYERQSATAQEQVESGVLADDLSRLTMQWWIGVKDHQLYQVEAQGLLPSQTLDAPLVPVNIFLQFTNNANSGTITVPTNPLSFNLAFPSLAAVLPTASARMLTIVSSSLPTYTVSNTDDPDGDGLNNELEAFYGTNPYNPDTDGDGLSDGQEVARGCNPLGHGALFNFGIGKQLVDCP